MQRHGVSTTCTDGHRLTKVTLPPLLAQSELYVPVAFCLCSHDSPCQKCFCSPISPFTMVLHAWPPIHGPSTSPSSEKLSLMSFPPLMYLDSDLDSMESTSRSQTLIIQVSVILLQVSRHHKLLEHRPRAFPVP